MSDLRTCEPASWIGSLAASRMPTFTPWNSDPAPTEVANDHGTQASDPVAIHAEGFAQGFEQGLAPPLERRSVWNARLG